MKENRKGKKKTMAKERIKKSKRKEQRVKKRKKRVNSVTKCKIYLKWNWIFRWPKMSIFINLKKIQASNDQNQSAYSAIGT